MPSWLKRLLRVVAAPALTVLLLWVWLRSLDARALVDELAAASAGLLAASAVTSWVHLVLRAARWQVLLDVAAHRPDGAEPESGDAVVPSAPTAPAPLGALLSYTAIGYLVTFAVPGRLGEVARPALLWTRHEVPAGRALASVLLERLLDVLTLAFLLGAFVVLAPSRAGAGLTRVALATLAALGIATAVGVVAHRTRRQRLDDLVRWLARRCVPRRWAAGAERLGLAFLEGFDSLLSPGAGWRLPLLSLVTWLPVLAGAYLALLATGLTLGPASVLLLVPLTALGIAVPTQAGIGGYHAVLTWGLVTFYASPAAKAGAAAVVAHAAAVLPVGALGLYCLWRERLGPSDVRRAVRQARGAGNES